MRTATVILLCTLIITFLTCKGGKKSAMRDMQCLRIDTQKYDTLELPFDYVRGDTIMYGHYYNTDSPYSAWYVVISEP